MSVDALPAKTQAILGSAIEVHRALGPGLLESTYRACLMKQLLLDGLVAEQEVAVPICYEGDVLDSGYRADIVVDGTVLVELKAVDSILPIHEAQLLTYLKHSQLRVGLLINFNVRRLMDGVRRFIRPTSHVAISSSRLLIR
jgi:GxxExxY protein